ncbi:ATP-grasp domain-containing protein [Longispora sp. K20-0274]|uniref:ATP-grasp domain-containing protein n=1 Tax=Longispora sp. K20-0274 TaxID=3088255 RepID=UPI00399A3E92
MTTDGLVLVVGSGIRAYREYLLASAAQRRPVWLLDAVEPTWQHDYAQGATVVELLDPKRLLPDQDLLVKTAVDLAAEHRIEGVFTYDETLVVTTAHIAEALGLRGLGVSGAEHCRNKQYTRERLTAAGILQPRFSYVTTDADARAAADEFGYPVVFKPRGMGASIGVVFVGGPGEVADAFAMSDLSSHGGNPLYQGGVLVEEYLTGPEISVDGATFDGEYRPFFVGRKRLGPEPYFEEVGHVVSADDPLLTDPGLVDMLAAAHRALGIRDGVTHTEVKLTDRGPAIVEVNGRLGGDLIPYLGRLATGIDPAHVAVDIATGVRPTLEPTLRRSVGIRFSYPEHDGRVLGVTLPAARPGLLEAAAMVQPGAELRLPPEGYLSRYAYVICAADTAEGCEAALDAASAGTAVTLEAL